MALDQARDELQTRYEEAGCTLVEKTPERLLFNFKGDHFLVDEQDLRQYRSFMLARPSLDTAPVECSLVGPHYREHGLRTLDQSFSSRRRFDKFEFAARPSDAVEVRISQATPLYTDFFRFDERFLGFVLRDEPRFRRSRQRAYKIRDRLYRPLTIQVANLEGETAADIVPESTHLIESCLFEVAYLKDVALWLRQEWFPRRPRFQDFGRDRSDPDHRPKVPEHTYNPDLIRFFQLGVSTDVPELQFLAYYQVLEYFFVTVSDDVLYQKLRNRIQEPGFIPDPQRLDRVVQDVLGHTREADETKMLRNVLDRFVPEDDVINFIQDYEDYVRQPHYTARRTLFGEAVEVPLKSGHVHGNVAKTIKSVRNALVHSSDRHERNPRHVPFSDTGAIVAAEIPLIRFLAERVLISTANLPG